MFGIFGFFLVATLEFISAAPTSDPNDSSVKFPIYFENGKIGVNFLGFHAAAGLGGLITGNNADGGLQAEAGTPFGQKAWAGLGGALNGAGRSAGGLYAGATAGGGVGAKAGIGGRTGSDGSAGTSYAGASAGGLYKGRVKTIGQPTINLSNQQEFVAPAVEDVNAEGSFGFQVGSSGQVESEGKYVLLPSRPSIEVQQFEDREYTSLPPLNIEFAEDNVPAVDTSNIQVITKKEKIKKVDKTVIAPIVQETDIPQAAFNLDVSAKAIVPAPPPPPPLPQFPVYVEKRKYKLRRRPHRKQVFITNEFIAPPSPPPPEVPVLRSNEGYFAGPSTFIVKKKFVTNGFDVPFSTVNEAEQLVGSFARRTEELPIKPVEIEAVGGFHNQGNVGLSKSFSVKAEASKPIALLNIEASKKISINS